jgi:hypothetical protein
MKYYCCQCGIKLGYINAIDHYTDFTGSVDSYLFDKYLKHTSQPLTSSLGANSIFKDSDYDTYKNYIIDTAKSGSVEVDNENRINLIWFANEETGQSFINGQFEQKTDSVKLVLHNNEQKIHAFPTSSFGLSTQYCSKCNAPIIV